MRITSDSLRATHALLRPDTAVAAAEALCDNHDKAVIEGLVELIYKPPTARAAVVAITSLDGCYSPVVLDALRAALDSPHSSVRVVAAQALQRRKATHAEEALLRVLRRDESWLVRRAALDALAELPDPARWQVLEAADDPHWRVRHALIQLFLRWGATETQRTEIDQRLTPFNDVRVRGLREYLRYRWTGDVPIDAPQPEEGPVQQRSFWDWDAAVLARNLERMGEDGRHEALDVMPYLLAHPDARVPSLSSETLRDWGEVRHLADAVRLLDEPRKGTVEPVAKLFGHLELDRHEEVARFILQLPHPSPAQLAWAVDQADSAFPADEEAARLNDLFARATTLPLPVRCTLGRLAGRWNHPDAAGWLRTLLDDPEPQVQLETIRGLSQKAGAGLDDTALRRLLDSTHSELRAEAVRIVSDKDGGLSLVEPLANDPDVRVRLTVAECFARKAKPEARLQADPHPHVRAAALTPNAAASLVREPDRETSWHVLAKAARMTKVPLWELGPEKPWRPERRAVTESGPLSPYQAEQTETRRLGPDGPLVARVGVSGHYGLPVEGFVRAAEAGVNLMFWEPNYQTLTEFVNRLTPSGRRAIHLIAGTFEADGRRVRRDAERVLRLLKIEQVSLFLVFWVQSWPRVSEDVSEELERLKEEGTVANFGLSTHSRPLAVEAMEAGWDPVMVRHSAAHRGAEPHVFPQALQRGTSLLTFNNTCYGRLLQAHGELPAPDAADCYRYTLAFPAVTACLSAPATLEELEENLAALRDPRLPDDRRHSLLQHGDAVYQEDTIFRKLVRAL